MQHDITSHKRIYYRMEFLTNISLNKTKKFQKCNVDFKLTLAMHRWYFLGNFNQNVKMKTNSCM